jgi:MoxR-like ATPase
MTSWSRLHNDIKRRPPEQHLTAKQREVVNVICDWLKYPGAVNLFGPAGSGKTYVAWALERVMGAFHIQLPSQLEQLEAPHDILVIDNMPHTEANVRRVLATCNLRNATSVVLITRLPITMRMQRIELPLPTSAEIDAVKADIAYLAFEQSPLPESPNFWQLLNSYS